MADFERDLADKCRKEHSDKMKEYRQTDKEVKEMELEKAVLHESWQRKKLHRQNINKRPDCGSDNPEKKKNKCT